MDKDTEEFKSRLDYFNQSLETPLDKRSYKGLLDFVEVKNVCTSSKIKCFRDLEKFTSLDFEEIQGVGKKTIYNIMRFLKKCRVNIKVDESHEKLLKNKNTILQIISRDSEDDFNIIGLSLVDFLNEIFRKMIYEYCLEIEDCQTLIIDDQFFKGTVKLEIEQL